MEPVLLISAFVAGIVMFLAPCTLPLIPAYLGFISGVTAHELEDETRNGWARRQILKNAAGFVLGFSAVFILFGTLAAFAGSIMGPYRAYLDVLAGMLVIVFGLLMLGVFNWSFLTKERRVALPSWFAIGTPASSVMLGGAFAFGWTPCIGPILGTILFLAGSTETVLWGGLLLALFSLGFSIPFLLLAIVISQATRVMDRIAPYATVLTKIGGFVIVLAGTFLVFGNLPAMTAWMFELFEGLDLENALMRYL